MPRRLRLMYLLTRSGGLLGTLNRRGVLEVLPMLPLSQWFLVLGADLIRKPRRPGTPAHKEADHLH